MGDVHTIMRNVKRASVIIFFDVEGLKENGVHHWSFA